ncbi:AfsR/SARP family transcriptional regulator [Streptacidiphilus anmyonensis]|uniref:AfsR/SARP family transcriptional regulator n=1 Tax=Streptacidiphilus anmyonensis TaxID=405782 RepID=UPI00069435ED|nr:AfsR/SARP family transcriptional regulator [Streptacidiphilus anmyonensis]
MRFRLLGPLGAEAQDRPLDLGPLKQRLVLAFLLCRPNTPVSVDTLTEVVWQDEPPRTARKNLQVYVSTLRRLFASVDAGREWLVHRPGGYLIRVDESELDTLRFQSLLRAGREAAADACDEAAHERAGALFAEALHLWSGPPLAELGHSPLVRAAAERLGAAHVSAVEDWAEVQLRLDNPRPVVNALADLAEQHPLRERLRALQLTALHQAGRRTEALAVYSELRQQLSRELGLSPSPELDACYRAVLTDQGSAARSPRPPARAAADAGEGPNGERLARAATRAPRPQPCTNRLPQVPAGFTGRAEELDDLVATVRSGRRLVAVTGPVGIGKTTLAVQAAHWLRDDFPDGQLFVRLARPDGTVRTPAEVVAELGRDTTSDEPAPASAEDALSAWRTWLGTRRLLLVLDDARDVESVRALLPEQGPASVVLTSRAPLVTAGAAARFELPPFTPQEALDLLAAVIGRRRVCCDPAAAEAIVTSCGLLPLAVSVAAHKLSVLRHVPLAEFADRLTDPHGLLDELAVGPVAVRLPLGDQWNALDVPERAALAQLGPLPLSVPFTLDQAADLMGRDHRHALREVERLIAAGVVVSPVDEVSAHAARYVLPPLTHVYARERV